MARKKNSSRIYSNPEEAARRVKELRAGGAKITGSKAAMRAIGVNPHSFTDESGTKMPDAQSIFLARQAAKEQPDPDSVYAPTATINPADPRTRAASYYGQTQTLVIEWGDGGVPYAYYDVPPQVWDAFTEADSPGRFINGVLNNYSYGPIGARENAAGQRRTNW